MKTPEEFLSEKRSFDFLSLGKRSRVCAALDAYAKYYHEQQVNSVDLADVVGQSEQLKAVEKLKDFAYEVCPLHREDDLEEIVCSL